MYKLILYTNVIPYTTVNLFECKLQIYLQLIYVGYDFFFSPVLCSGVTYAKVESACA